MKAIVVASTNPVKIQSAQMGFARMFPDDTFIARGVAVESGVSAQPMTDAETYQGALNRANNAAVAVPDADYWVGIEGGLEEKYGDLHGVAWIVVTDGQRTGKSRTASFVLPAEVTRLIHAGHELGHADDIVFKRSNSKQDNGSVGILTSDVLTRTTYYEHAVILALIPFLNGDLTF
ncbi:MAG: inositol monophosphatase [Anaerolineaceae bacterium]|nr:inositol monophosphatase [Anaerolineaceae bacterium]